MELRSMTNLLETYFNKIKTKEKYVEAKWDPTT